MLIFGLGVVLGFLASAVGDNRASKEDREAGMTLCRQPTVSAAGALWLRSLRGPSLFRSVS